MDWFNFDSFFTGILVALLVYGSSKRRLLSEFSKRSYSSRSIVLVGVAWVSLSGFSIAESLLEGDNGRTTVWVLCLAFWLRWLWVAASSPKQQGSRT